MVVIKRSVRATSVPVGRVSRGIESDTTSYLLDVDNTATARRISNTALDDTDALMTASKRHDQQLLSDINARLANASFKQPVAVKQSTTTTHSSSREKPPLPMSRPPTTLRRYLIHHVDDEDLDELTRMPATPVTSSVIRSSSVPPRLPRLPTRGGLPSTSRYHHVTRIDQPEDVVYQQYGVPVFEKVVHDSHATNHPSHSLPSSAYLSTDTPITVSLTPVADLAVRQAYRNLDRIDKEMKLTYDHPNGPQRFSTKTYVAQVQPVTARRPPSTYVRSAPLMTSRRTSSVSPSRTNIHLHRHHAHSPSPSDILLLRSMSPSPITLPVTSAHVALPADLQTQHITADLLKTSKMEDERPLLLTNVYKPARIVEPVLPYSTYVKPRTAHVTTDVITTSPASVPLVKEQIDYTHLPPTSVRPKVSETRRKVREVLCKIKKDPHYFD